MSRGVKGSQSSAAREMVSSMGAPAGLSSFLGGFATGTEGSSDAERESDYVVNLKLLSKTSEITKQKAFDRLLELLTSTSDDVLLQFASATTEAVIQHAQHAKPVIRAASYQLLHGLMSRSKAVKRAVAPELKVLAGVWVMGMHDMEAPVCQAAAAAFDAAFPGDKKTQMLQQFMDAILDSLRGAVGDVASSKKPLHDDALDPNANKFFAALKAMGYMVKQVSAAQPAVLKFVQDTQTFGALLPPREMPKSYLLGKTPLARSAVLALLRDVVAFCPASPKIHQLVSQALFGSILDPNPAVASRTWELFLYWCRTNVADVVSHMKANFLDDVVNSFMECQQGELAEVIFPCLFPLLTTLSKDARCEGILDEFCAALAERLRSVNETPNVSARELEVLLTAVMECWELHCVRKRSSRASEDSVELLTVISFNVVELMQADAKATRYHSTVTTTVAKSLLKTATRCPDVFQQCMRVIAAQPDAPFRVLPDDASAAVQSSFALFQARLLGRLCTATLAAAAAPPVTPERRAEGASSSHSKLVVTQLADAWLVHEVSSSDSGDDALRWTCLAAFFGETHGAAYRPGDAAADAVLGALCASVRQQRQAGDGAAADGSSAGAGAAGALASVVQVGLRWKERPAAQTLMDATASAAEASLKAAARRHLMQDPEHLSDVLERAVVHGDVADAEECAAQYRELGRPLTEAERQRVLAALSAAIAETLAAVTRTDEDESSSSSSRSSGGDSSDSASSSSAEDVSSASSSDGASASGSSSAASVSDGDEAGDDNADDNAHNHAPAVRDRLMRWAALLASGGDLAQLLHVDVAYVVAHVLRPFSHISAAIVTSIFVERYVSMSAVRDSLAAQQAASDSGGDGDGDGPGGDSLTYAMSHKANFSSMADCEALAEAVKALLDGYAVPTEQRDGVAVELLRGVFSGDAGTPLCFLAVHLLSQLVPYASQACLQSFVTTEQPWAQTAIEVRAAELAGNDVRLSLYTGHLSLDLLSPTLTRATRTAQLVRLMDSVDGAAAAAAVARAEPKTVAQVFCQLLRVAAAQEVLAGGVRHMLYSKVLPAFMACFDVAEVAVEVAALVTAPTGPLAAAGVPYLLPTLASVLRQLATPEDLIFLRRAIRVVSAVASAGVSALFHAQGAKGIAASVASTYTTFFAVLDEAADQLRCNIAAQLPEEQERLLLEASCQLPTWDLTTAKLTLVLVRHLASMPAVADSTVKSLMAYAAKQTPLAGLELLCELACTRIPTPDVYSELIRVVVDGLCRCHRLRHLPSNGRLQRETGVGSLAAGAPVALTSLRRVVMAAVLARRGVVLHSRMDSVLRSTVNLVVFDAVCEAVSRLRSTKPEDVAPLTALIAFTSRFMGELLTLDVKALRASVLSVEKVATVLCFAYAWLNATKIAQLEKLGVATVAGVMRSVCLLANLTLVHSTAVPMAAAMRPITQRPSLKPLRDEYSTSQPAKVAQFRLKNAELTKTHKQKLLLFPYLLGWCVALTSAPAPPATDDAAGGSPTTATGGGGGGAAARDKEWQWQVYGLLDLLFVLMLTRTDRSTTRLDSTFIGASLLAGGAGDMSVTGQLGFEVAALTRVTAADQMAELARGAFAVFTQLLRGATLSLTKSWLDTVERKAQALFHSFVGQHISSYLIQESFLSVLSHSPDNSSSFSVGDSCTVEVNVAQQLIDLSYEMEDAKVAVRISFPSAFPLRPPAVEYESGRECGVSMKKWRAWMLRMSVILFGGSANVWECIDLFHQNLEAHFRGIEPCPICFAVVSAVNHKLPDVRCSVCHNSAFHSNCLYTWWATGSNNVCPLCRSPWIAE